MKQISLITFAVGILVAASVTLAAGYTIGYSSDQEKAHEAYAKVGETITNITNPCFKITDETERLACLEDILNHVNLPGPPLPIGSGEVQGPSGGETLAAK